MVERYRNTIIVDGKGTERQMPFPDKKRRNLDFNRVTNYLQEGRDIYQEFEIGQREATWIPRAEYPDLPIVLALLTDLHYGSINVEYDLLKKHLDIVSNTPNFYMASNGDEVDAFNAVFHPTGMTENPLPPQIQSRAIGNKLIEMDRNHKIAVLSHGNHTDSGREGGQDWWDSFLSDFRAPIFTSGGVLTAAIEGQEYRMIMNHTYWGKSKLNVTNAAKRLMEYEGGGDIDIAFIGHTHQSSYEHFERGGKDVLAVVGGTYKLDDPWAARNGIGGRGQSPGICVMLWPGKRMMQPIKDIETARDFLLGLIGKH